MKLTREQILLSLIFSLLTALIIFKSSIIGLCFIMVIAAYIVEGVMDAMRYKKNEGIKADLKTLVDSINAVGDRVGKLELTNSFKNMERE